MPAEGVPLSAANLGCCGGGDFLEDCMHIRVVFFLSYIVLGVSAKFACARNCVRVTSEAVKVSASGELWVSI